MCNPCYTYDAIGRRTMNEILEGRKGTRAPRSDAQRNRSMVLDAEWRLLATSSPEELRMDDIARELGMGKGTLYRHYPTKECLFVALLQRGADRIADRMRESIPPEADAATKLRLVISILYEIYDEFGIRVDHLRELIPHAEAASDTGEQPQPFLVISTRIRAILEQGVREGIFRPLDLDYSTSAVLGLTMPL